MRNVTTLVSAAAMAVAGGYAALPAPARAQATQSEIVVYGNDPCPRESDDKIVVCKRRPEAERYRIAPKLRPSGTPQQMESWSRRSQPLTTVGATGINSCSPVGPASCWWTAASRCRSRRRRESHPRISPRFSSGRRENG